MDKILINKLALNTIIGTLDFERQSKQKLLCDIELSLDLSAAAETDDLTKSVDYQALSDKIRTLAAESKFLLIERLAGEIAKICLAPELVQNVKITLYKPNALAFAAAAAVVIERRK